MKFKPGDRVKPRPGSFAPVWNDVPFFIVDKFLHIHHPNQKLCIEGGWISRMDIGGYKEIYFELYPLVKRELCKTRLP